MSRHDLSEGVPSALLELPHVYLLGVGGPEDAAGIGRVETFVWRFALLDDAPRPTALGFTSMPRLMAFTRAVNGVSPHRVPTEATRVAPSSWAAGLPVVVWLDPAPADFERHAAGRPLVERRVPGLEG